MANNEANPDVTQRVQQTLSDSTNLTYGADNAAGRLQNDVYQNYQQLGGGQSYSAYLDQVTANITHTQAFPEVAAAWTSHNTQRFDMNGDGRLDQGEINSAIGGSRDPLERQILISVRDQYQNIKHAGGDGFLGIRPDAIEPGDFNDFAGQNQAVRDRAAALALQQNHSRYLMQPLLITDDGNPNQSLFRVLDNVTGGGKDGNVSKHDLKGFVDQYDRAAMNGGDVNQGAWTRANRDFAQHLAQNWNTPEVVALRGQYTEENERGSTTQTNSYITERSLLSASGYANGSNLYQVFERPRAQPPKEAAPVARPEQCGPSPDQLAQARADFQRQLQDHINQEAHYTVRAGQGYDVIARDVIKSHSRDDSYRDPHKIVSLSDKIAKMNGRSGRLSKDPILYPGEELTVFDDNWVQTQIQQRMRRFDQSVPKPNCQPSDDPGY